MSASLNYNAMTNLTEMVIDYLVVDTAEIDTAIVDNLDCNVGTIDTLNSTTATITSANIPTLTSTTGNITTHIGDIWQGTSTTSNMRIGSVADTGGVISVYKTMSLLKNLNINTSNGAIYCSNFLGWNGSADITFFQSVILAPNQNLTLQGGTGKITAPNILVSGLTASKLVLTDASDNLVSSLYTDTDFARLTANNIFTGSNTFNSVTISSGFVLNVRNISSLANNDNINFGYNMNAGMLYIAQGQTSGNVFIGNLTPASDTGTLNINKNTTLGAGKSITVSTSGAINCKDYNSTSTAQSITLAGNLLVGTIDIGTAQTSGNIRIGNITPASDTGTLTINKTTLLATNKNLTLQGTGKITTPAILVSGLTASKLVLTDASDNLVSSLYDETTLPVSTPTQTALNLKANIDNPTFTTKITTPVITFNGTQTASSKILLTDASKNIVSSLYDETTLPVSTPQQTALNLKANINNPTFTGVIIASEIQSPLYNSTNATTLLEIGKTSTSGDIYLAQAQTSGNCVIGNLVPANDIGGLTINKFTTLATGKSLTLSSTSNFISDNIRGTNIATSTSVYPTTTSGSITIGGALSSGSINLGVIGMTGNISCNSNVGIGTSASNKGLSCNFYASFTNSSIVQFCRNLTTGELRIAPEMTTGPITIGNLTPASDTGTLTINRNTTMATGKTLNVNDIQGTTTSSNITLFTNTSGGSATISIGNSSGGVINLNSNVVLPTTETLSLTTLNSNGSSSSLSIGGNITNNDISIGSNINVGNINIGNISASNAPINLNSEVVVGNNKNLSLQGTGKLTTATIEHPLVSGDLGIGGNLTSGFVSIGEALTSGLIILGERLTVTSGYTLFNHRLRQIRSVSSIDRTSFWNVAVGSANNIFQSSFISASAMPPVYAGAQTDGWNVWEGDTTGEACFIAQNGNTAIICNPGDNSAFHWQDEDTMGSASGFKFSTTGVMTTSSDRRLKRDIKPIPVENDLLDKLSSIEYVNYKKKAPTEEKYYRNGKLRRKYQDIHKGLIAQDVKKLFPEVVEKEGEYHMMKYAEVDIYFNMGVQELIKRDKEKQVIIDDLTTRLARLEQLILNP